MEKKYQDKIFKDFSHFFKHKKNLRQSLMGFGLMCGKGWFKLIYNLCKNIDKYFTANPEKKPRDFEVVEIKEKFGGLRFYITSAPKEIYIMIKKTSNKSFKICESCGKKGKTREGNFVITMCNKCWKKTNNSKIPINIKLKK
jgi:hypothetical protein